MSEATEDLLIQSKDNPLVKQIQKLVWRRERTKTNSFLIEGSREINLAIEGGIEIQDLLYCDTLPRFTRSSALVEKAKTNASIRVANCIQRVFEKLTYTKNSEGVLAVAKQPSSAPIPNLNSNSVYLVVDSIEKPGNLGAMFRSADAINCEAVLVADPNVEVYNPNVIRSSLGSVFVVPHVECDAEELISRLINVNLRIIATSPQASEIYSDIDLSSNCAIVIGSEKDGLSSTWLDSATQTVRLPAEGMTDSINASAAATVMLFESYRQHSVKAT